MAVENRAQLNPLAMTYLRAMKGVVVDNDDPLKMGRVRVRIYSIQQSKEDGIKDEQLLWAQPMFLGAAYNSGQFIVPEVESVVLVIFEQGDKDTPLYLGGFYGVGREKVYKWKMVGGLERENKTNQLEVPRSVRNLDTRVLYQTPKGHRILFRDDDSNECIVFSDALGQAFAAEGHTEGSVRKIEEYNDQDDGTEGNQPDNSGNTSVDDKKLALVSGSPVIQMRGLSGSVVRLTSSAGSSKTEVISEGQANASIVMEGGESESTLEGQAGMPEGMRFKYALSKDKFEVKGPCSTFSMDSAGNITLTGLTLTLRSLSGTQIQTGFCNITAMSSIKGLAQSIMLIDRSPVPSEPTVNTITKHKQKYPQLNKKTGATGSLDLSSLSNSIDGLPSSAGSSYPTVDSISKNAASVLSSGGGVA